MIPLPKTHHLCVTPLPKTHHLCVDHCSSSRHQSLFQVLVGLLGHGFSTHQLQVQHLPFTFLVSHLPIILLVPPRPKPFLVFPHLPLTSLVFPHRPLTSLVCCPCPLLPITFLAYPKLLPIIFVVCPKLPPKQRHHPLAHPFHHFLRFLVQGETRLLPFFNSFLVQVSTP